jgi:hypothetical protein
MRWLIKHRRRTWPATGYRSEFIHDSSIMTFIQKLEHAWTSTGSLLTVGLDPDPQRFPAELAGKPNAVFEFCRAIVDVTAQYACAVKPTSLPHAPKSSSRRCASIFMNGIPNCPLSLTPNAATSAPRPNSMRTKHTSATRPMP